MRIRLRALLFLLMTPAALAGAPFTELTLGEALEEAERSSRLLLLDFRAEWCGPCRKMEAETWPDERLGRWLAAHALVLQVDWDGRQDLVSDHEIRALPTVVAIRAGEEIDRLRGFVSAGELRSWLEGLALGRTSLDLQRERAGSREDDPLPGEARLRLAHALFRHHGLAEEAADELLFLWRARSEGRPGSRTCPREGLTRLSQVVAGEAPGLRVGLRHLQAELSSRAWSKDATIEEALTWLELNSVLGSSEQSLEWLEPFYDDPAIEHFLYDYTWFLLPTLTRDGHWAAAGRLIRPRLVKGLSCWIRTCTRSDLRRWACAAVALFAAERDEEAERVLDLIFEKDAEWSRRVCHQLLAREDVGAALGPVLPARLARLGPRAKTGP